MSFTYTVFRLPIDSTSLSNLLDRFVDFRLTFLREGARDLAHTSDYESKLTKEQWLSRLQNPRKHNLILVAHDSSSPPIPKTLDNGKWVGFLHLIGPLSRTEYILPEDEPRPDVGSDAQEVRFQSASWYINSAHRGGHGTLAVLEYVLDLMRSTADEVLAPNPHGPPVYARLRGDLYEHNRDAVDFETAFGFQEVGWWTSARAYGATDFAEAIASREDQPELYERKTERVMEVLIEC